MAITRFFSQTPTRNPLLLLLLLHRRHKSTKAQQAQLKLEEVIQSLIARRAAPDWLPFLPGYSYYAPPPPAASHPGKFFEVSDSPMSLRRYELLSNHDTMSFSTNRGLPSSTYFIKGTPPTQPLPMGLVVDMKIYDSDEAAQESSDEE